MKKKGNMNISTIETQSKMAAIGVVLASVAHATNGDHLERIGALSEALGGTGVAAPQDGLTAIVESYLTLGLGYRVSEHLTVDVAYAHVFENTIRSTSAGEVIQFESSLKEDVLGIGLTWAF